MSYFCSKCVSASGYPSIVTYRVVEGDSLVRDLWPAPLASEMDCVLDKDDLATWAVVPDTYDGVCEWAVVMPLEEGRQNESTLLYSTDHSPSSEGTPVRVTVVAHGVVESLNLKALGNYRG